MTIHNLGAVMEGDLEDLTKALIEKDQEERLKQR